VGRATTNEEKTNDFNPHPNPLPKGEGVKFPLALCPHSGIKERARVRVLGVFYSFAS